MAQTIACALNMYYRRLLGVVAHCIIASGQRNGKRVKLVSLLRYMHTYPGRETGLGQRHIQHLLKAF